MLYNYEIVELRKQVPGIPPIIFRWKWRAERRCRKLNKEREVDYYRHEVLDMRDGTWAVVTLQNQLRPIRSTEMGVEGLDEVVGETPEPSEEPMEELEVVDEPAAPLESEPDLPEGDDQAAGEGVDVQEVGGEDVQDVSDVFGDPDDSEL